MIAHGGGSRMYHDVGAELPYTFAINIYLPDGECMDRRMDGLWLDGSRRARGRDGGLMDG